MIFKIFLSPLDPKADLLRSQLRIFFPGPSPEQRTGPEDIKGYEEFEYNEGEVSLESPAEQDERSADRLRGLEGFDLEGRRGGVWIRKPRSSRAGSGGEFIRCAKGYHWRPSLVKDTIPT